MPSVSQSQAPSPTLQILSIVCFSFIGFFGVGVTLAVIPGLAHDEWGYSTLLAGLVISLQYLVTLALRPFAGRLIDRAGPKRAVMLGLAGSAVSGALMVLATRWDIPSLNLGLLLLSRVALGMWLSLVASASIAWGIGLLGGTGTARVISWNGIACYGGIALGAPLGIWLVGNYGYPSMGLSVLLFSLAGLALAWGKAGVPLQAGERLGFLKVLGRVMPHGLALTLGTIGYGTIAAFITLYYSSRGWAYGEYCLTAFGFSFIAARLLFAQAIDRFGGFPVAIASLLVECLGLVLLWAAADPLLAMAGAALAGFGLSLVFPALGVEAVKLAPASSRGSAIGAYSLFLDLALGITGPLVGLIVTGAGFRPAFLFCALAAFCGLGLTLALQGRATRGADTGRASPQEGSERHSVP